MKSAFKEIGKAVIIFGSVIFGGIIFFWGLFFFIIMYTARGGIGDYLSYKDSLKTKEDVFQMIYDNQAEYEKLVSDMAEILAESGDDFIMLNEEEREYDSNGIESSLLKDFPIISMVAERDEDGYLEVDFSFTFAPALCDYWGVYYSESDEPIPWGNGEIVEENGILVERGSFYICEMEKIIDNWYYYQCRA